MAGKVTSYTLTISLDSESWGKLLKAGVGAEGDPEKANRENFPDTLKVQVTDAESLKLDIRDSISGKPVPITQLTNFAFAVPTRFVLEPDGVHCILPGKAEELVIVPGGAQSWGEWYTPERTLADLLESVKEDKPGPQAAALPDTFPQQTFEEMRILTHSLADTPTLRNWTPAEDKNAYLYQRPGERHNVKFYPAGLPDIWTGTKPNTLEAMGAFLRKRGWKAVLTGQVAANAALFREHERIAIDDFVRLLFDTRSVKERNTKRAWVWETLCAIFALRLDGVRAGKYTDPDTKQVIDLAFHDEPLIAPSPGTRTFAEGQQSLWPDDIPVTIGFTMGKWGVEARKNAGILAHFGNVQAILDIPGGKPSGAWAQCILLTLNQKWREKAKGVTWTSRPHIDAAGNERKAISTKWPYAFTRRELLAHLYESGQEFSVRDILDDRPGRAVKYWNEAIRILKPKHISHCAELKPLDRKRQGWADKWLDQPLDIRPNLEGCKAAIEIANSHKKAMAARKKKAAKKKPATPNRDSATFE